MAAAVHHKTDRAQGARFRLEIVDIARKMTSIERSADTRELSGVPTAVVNRQAIKAVEDTWRPRKIQEFELRHHHSSLSALGVASESFFKH
jgi:hypothetical protein